MISDVPIVGLREADRPYLQLHFLCLGDEGLRTRFGAVPGPRVVREYVARIDFVRDRLFAVQGDEGSLAAVAHVAFGGGAAQVAVTVLPGWRGRGLGEALLDRAMAHLRNRRGKATAQSS